MRFSNFELKLQILKTKLTHYIDDDDDAGVGLWKSIKRKVRDERVIGVSKYV